MTTPQIEITISPSGETKLETKGFSGSTCQQATRALEAALGLKQSESLTTEFYQTTSEETGVVVHPVRES